MDHDADNEDFVYRRNAAPHLPHYGKAFVYHGPSGVLTLRIDMQTQIDGDHIVQIGGIVLEGMETYPTGHVQDLAGKFVGVWVTETDYMRLSNGPEPIQ